MSADYRAYAQYQMRIFEAKQREFSQRKVVRLKLKKFICVSKTCAAIAKEFVGDHKNVFIAIGSTNFAANSPIKGKTIHGKNNKQMLMKCIINISGYVRVPHRKLVSAYREVADVFLEDEFRTTMLCANCHRINITSQSPHRYQFCPNCRTHWHRDVNGGANILYRAECRIREIALHPNYIRGNLAY